MSPTRTDEAAVNSWHARPDDLPTLRRLVRSYIDTWFPPGVAWSAADQQLVAALPVEHGSPSGTALLASAGSGAPVGCVLLRPHPTQDGAAELRKLHVTPAARHIGVGAGLLDAAERTAEELGYRQLVLDAAANRTAAVALHLQRGFHRSAGTGTHHDMTTMHRALP